MIYNVTTPGPNYICRCALKAQQIADILSHIAHSHPRKGMSRHGLLNQHPVLDQGQGVYRTIRKSCPIRAVSSRAMLRSRIARHVRASLMEYRDPPQSRLGDIGDLHSISPNCQRRLHTQISTLFMTPSIREDYPDIWRIFHHIHVSHRQSIQPFTFQYLLVPNQFRGSSITSRHKLVPLILSLIIQLYPW